MADAETKEEKTEHIIPHEIPKQPISEAVNYETLYWHQKILYYILYPLIFLLDIKLISKREWIQLPLLTYFIEVTQLMMAITFVQVHIQGLETRATLHRIAAGTVAFYLFLYTLIIAIICLISLYCFKRFTTKPHYTYFVELSTHLIGYGLLYLCVLIQYEWFSTNEGTVWSWFFILLIYAFLTVAVIILMKQFIFEVSMMDNIMKQYKTYYNLYKIGDDSISINRNDESEMVSLIPDNVSNESRTNRELLLTSFEEHAYDINMDNFWFTIFIILQNMWSIAIGFILVECVVYIFINDYVDLLVRWQEFRHRSSILDETWNMILFGLGLAVITALMEGFMELTLKKPCYEFIGYERDNGYHRFLVFILNWLNEIGILWFDILAACIGWSLLTPNQTDQISDQFEWAILGTLGFVIFGVLTQKFKNKKDKNILNKMDKIKNDETELNKERKLMNNVRNLIFYNKMIRTYNAAFAVSVSFAWETFIALALQHTATGIVGLENHWLTLLFTLLYAIFIGFAFTELGLLLIDLRKQRLHEIHLRNEINRQQQ